MKKLVTTLALVSALFAVTAGSASASTAGQRNALSSAQDYLRSGEFSKSGLIGQLKFEDFTGSEARWAVGHVRVNWNAQAVKSAKSYLRQQGVPLVQNAHHAVPKARLRAGLRRVRPALRPRSGPRASFVNGGQVSPLAMLRESGLGHA